MTAFRCTVAPTTVAPTTSDEDSGSGADDLNKKLNDLLNVAIDDSSATSLAVGIATHRCVHRRHSGVIIR